MVLSPFCDSTTLEETPKIANFARCESALERSVYEPSCRKAFLPLLAAVSAFSADCLLAELLLSFATEAFAALRAFSMLPLLRICSGVGLFCFLASAAFFSASLRSARSFCLAVSWSTAFLSLAALSVVSFSALAFSARFFSNSAFFSASFFLAVSFSASVFAAFSLASCSALSASVLSALSLASRSALSVAAFSAFSLASRSALSAAAFSAFSLASRSACSAFS